MTENRITNLPYLYGNGWYLVSNDSTFKVSLDKRLFPKVKKNRVP